MTDPSLRQIKIHSVLAVFLSAGIFSCAYAQAPAKPPIDLNEFSASTAPVEPEKELSQMQQQARSYRKEGAAAQKMGKWEEAMSWYQKAVQIDPGYAVAFNDLGVCHEMMGDVQQAEEDYLSAVSIDPGYAQAYTNLAIMAENNRDLKKAAYYWKKRSQLGSPQNIWTRKAKKRYVDICVLLGEMDPKEQEVMTLTDTVVKKKALANQDNKTLAESYFDSAQEFARRHDYAKAMKYASDSLLLDPSNKQAAEFIEKLQKQVLSK